MKFPEQYIQRGEFKLHSGQVSNVFYEVNALLADDHYLEKILAEIDSSEHYIGIATGGAIIARLISRERKSKFSMIKDGGLKGNLPLEDWILIDDVATTGKSLVDALNIVGKNPSKIWVVLDRRIKNENPEVCSVFEI